MSMLLMSLAESIRNLRFQMFIWKLLVINFFFVRRSVSAIIFDLCVWWLYQYCLFLIATLCKGGVHRVANLPGLNHVLSCMQETPMNNRCLMHSLHFFSLLAGVNRVRIVSGALT